MSVRFGGIAVALVAALAANVALAQDYPSKPVTIIVPFTAGGPTDVVARVVAAAAESRLKQSVLIDNKPGVIFHGMRTLFKG